MAVTVTAGSIMLGVLGALLLSAIYITSVGVYRVFFHPLSSYPGPVLAKVSNLYAGYHAWKGDIHVDMWRCHEKYGSRVRYAPNKLLFNTEKATQDIYGYSSNVVKSSAYNALLHRAANILTVRDKTQHSRRKRFISQGFSDSSLRSLEPIVIEKILRFCDKITSSGSEIVSGTDKSPLKDRGWSAVRNVASWCDYLAFDIMSGLIFSSNYDALGKPEFRWVPDAISESNVRVSVLIQAPEVSLWRLDKRLFPRAIKARNSFIGFVSKLLKDRLVLSKTESPKDVFSFLAKAKDPEGGPALSPTELGAESTTLVVAGSDTTSTAMAAMLFYLTRNPDALQRATNEVRSKFTSVEEIRHGTQLNSCMYLRACIDETLRMSPPAGSALWREVLHGGATIDGEHIPEGYDVGVCIYALHHTGQYHPLPFLFDPERWLENDDAAHGSEGPSHNPRRAYAPFSSGPRGCIGKGLALMELMLTMAIVLFMLEFETVELPHESTEKGSCGVLKQASREDEYQTRDHVTAAKDGPFLHFRQRV